MHVRLRARARACVCVCVCVYVCVCVCAGRGGGMLVHVFGGQQLKLPDYSQSFKATMLFDATDINN